jgi:hypothetical protein
MFIIIMIVAFLTSFPGLPVKAQYVGEVETVDAQYYGGVETTYFGVRDPETGVWVQVPASRLPWWWTPPPDWVLWSTLGIATAAVVMSAVFIGEGLSFGSVVINDYRYRGRLSHFHHFRDYRVGGQRFREHYQHARGAAEKGYPGGLRHPPGPRGPAGSGSGSQQIPNSVRGPRSPGASHGAGIHQSGPGNVRSPRGPSGSPSFHPGMSGPRSPGQMRGPQTGHVNRQPNIGQSRTPQPQRPTMAPRNTPHAPAPVHQQAPRGGGGKPQPPPQPQQQKRGR